MKPHFIFGQSEPDYRAGKPALSQSLLKTLLTKSPAHIRHQIDNPTESTPAQKLGAAAHVRILEGAVVFSELHAVLPPCDRRTKAGKETYEAFLAEHGGKDIITADDFQQIEDIAAATLAHPLAGALFKGGAAEVSLFGTACGVEMKGRADYLHVDAGVMVDLKTCLDASPDAVQKYAVNYGLHIQQFVYAELYRSITGKAPADFVFVMVEKSPPFGVSVVRLTKAAVEAARAEVERALTIWQECERTGIWPSYGDTVITVDLPAWKYCALDRLEVAA